MKKTIKAEFHKVVHMKIKNDHNLVSAVLKFELDEEVFPLKLYSSCGMGDYSCFWDEKSAKKVQKFIASLPKVALLTNKKKR